VWPRMLPRAGGDACDLAGSRPDGPVRLASNFDHYHPTAGDTDGPCPEGRVALSALAVHTSRPRIGHVSLANSRQCRERHGHETAAVLFPAVIAKVSASSLAVVTHLAGSLATG